MGIHHVTAIAGDPQRNLDFYAGVLGLRLVKLTVNFDDPGTYHLYYGDEIGRPGSILTFFPWPGGRRGRQGAGQVDDDRRSAFPRHRSATGSSGCVAQGIEYRGPGPRDSTSRCSPSRDPDGLLLELVATPRVSGIAPWADGPLPAEHAVRGLHGVTICGRTATRSARFLTGTWASQLGRRGGEPAAFRVGGGGVGSVVDLRRAPGSGRAQVGVGTVHHVAFRAATDEASCRGAASLEPARRRRHP